MIWKPGTRFDSGWKGYKASNMKTVALVGTDGMIDMWAAFIRTMNKDDKGRADAARKEASRLEERGRNRSGQGHDREALIVRPHLHRAGTRRGAEAETTLSG